MLKNAKNKTLTKPQDNILKSQKSEIRIRRYYHLNHMAGSKMFNKISSWFPLFGRIQMYNSRQHDYRKDKMKTIKRNILFSHKEFLVWLNWGETEINY